MCFWWDLHGLSNMGLMWVKHGIYYGILNRSYMGLNDGPQMGFLNGAYIGYPILLINWSNMGPFCKTYMGPRWSQLFIAIWAPDGVSEWFRWTCIVIQYRPNTGPMACSSHGSGLSVYGPKLSHGYFLRIGYVPQVVLNQIYILKFLNTPDSRLVLKGNQHDYKLNTGGENTILSIKK